MTPNEHTTRKQRIDRQLNRAGWEVGNLAQVGCILTAGSRQDHPERLN